MKILLFTSTLLSGLVAGLFYAWSCSVIPGLKTLTNSDYLKAMQAMNTAIQNPVFFLSFMGLIFVYPVALWQMYEPQPGIAFYFLLLGAVIYFAGVFGVTIFGNVPLNNQLDQFVIPGTSENELSAMRRSFEQPWNSLHSIRTIGSVLAFAITLLSCFMQKAK